MPRKKAGATPAVTGWMPKQRTRRVELTDDYWEPADGAEPLWVELVASLTFDECDAIPFGVEVAFADVQAAIAPYVLAWNVRGRNAQTREYELLPAPVEAGPDVFRATDRMLPVYLARELKWGPLPVGAQKKESTATDDTAGG